MPLIKRRSSIKQTLHINQQGFTLLEVMLALSFGSLIMLSAAQTYPLLSRQISTLGQHHRLEQVLRNAVFIIEKDLRRAGFCNGLCQGQEVMIANRSGEISNSCVIVAYDLNRNGQWEQANHIESEYFGYRLRKGVVEGSRGASDCQSSGWESLLDPQQVVITHFAVIHQRRQAKRSKFMLQLAGHWTRHPVIHRKINRVISGNNV